jgi:mRNA export factor
MDSVPVLGLDWRSSNDVLYFGTAANQVKMWDLKSGSVMDIGSHDAPVKDVFYVDAMNQCVVSAGWDGMVKFWDTRSPQPMLQQDLTQKIFSMSISQSLLVAALSTHQIYAVNLQDTMRTGQINPCLVVQSPLKYQTRHIEAFPKGNGYAITSIEGRCGVKQIDFNNIMEKYATDFNFKCH